MRTAVLILALTALACLAETGREAARIGVHEWGVLVYGDDAQSGMLMGLPEDRTEPAAVRAPVVYFHGPEFQGTFTVTLPGGEFTQTLPEPSELECNVAVWELDASWERERRDSADPTALSASRGVPAGGDPHWADVASMMLRTGTGAVSRYLFYECSLRPALLEPDAWLTPVAYDGSELLLPPLLAIPEVPLDPELLVLAQSGDGPVIWRGTGAQLAEAGLEGLEWSPYSRDLAMRALMDWNGTLLEPDELGVMWDTWESWAVRRDNPEGFVILSPLRQDKLGLISRLTLDTEYQNPVVYSRFYLGALVLSDEVPVRRVSPDEGQDLR